MASLGERMRAYESAETGRRLIPMLPALARLDGRCFHSFTRDLERPYDIRLSNLMQATALHLVRETGALLGYTQSDEITLVFYSESFDSQIFFDGKPYKMMSILAAMASVYFNYLVPAGIPGKPPTALFDCRVWNVPTKEEAANALIERELDATRNSISMAAQSVYSHKELTGKNCTEMQEMLFEKGINWNDYPAFFKRGTYFQRTTVKRRFTCNEIEKLPSRHEARTNPNLMVVRSEVRTLGMPSILQVANRVAVIFDGETPRTEANNG